MSVIIANIDGFVVGDDLTLQETITVPSGTALLTAWFMVKRSVLDADVDALISKTITSGANTHGQITDIGTLDLTGVTLFYLTAEDTALLTPYSVYPYSIKVKLNNTKVFTPIKGSITAVSAVKKLSV